MIVTDSHDETRMRRVTLLRSFAEVPLITAAFEEAGIPVLVRPFNDPAFGSFWRRNEGWGELLAREQDVEAALRICRDLRGRGGSEPTGG